MQVYEIQDEFGFENLEKTERPPPADDQLLVP